MKLGDTKYQAGKYQIGKYLASFAWTSVAQLAEVSKPGIAREREATFPQLGICLRALGRALKPRPELLGLVGFVGDRQVAPRQTYSGGQRHQVSQKHHGQQPQRQVHEMQ